MSKKGFNNKRPCEKRRVVIIHKVKHDCFEIREDPLFVELFISLILEMRKIANKKGFNKKEFSGVFSRFNYIIGAYPFPEKFTTQYMKKFVANV